MARTPVPPPKTNRLPLYLAQIQDYWFHGPQKRFERSIRAGRHELAHNRVANRESQNDPATATKLWTAVDQDIVDVAPLIPLVIPEGVDVVSPRVGNYQNNPAWGILLDQLWVR